MPMQRSHYPADWLAISLVVRERAGWCCEQCGIANGTLKPNGTRVVLTVHHLGIDKPGGVRGSRHDKFDVRPENLRALCQACHLAADMDIHVANAAATRRRKRIAAGQRVLPGLRWGDGNA